MSNPSCWICKHYCQKSHLVTRGLNVSGKPARYRIWSKHRCALKQEDRYPKHCNFEENAELREELRSPDLAEVEDKPPPPRRSGTIKVRFKYVGRSKPIPIDDPWA